MRVDRLSELKTPPTLPADGLGELPEGRWQVNVSDGATTHLITVEKRARAMAIKLGDRWYGIRGDGTFSFFARDAAAIQAGAARTSGRISYADERLRVELSEGEALVLCSGSTPVEAVHARQDKTAQRVLLKGTA